MRHPLYAMALCICVVAGLLACGVAPNDPDGPTHQRPPDSRLDPTGYAELSQQHVDAVFAEQQAGFSVCSRKAGGAFVGGVARLMFLLRPDGRVEHVYVAESDVGSLEVERCLLTAARFMEFPVPPGSGRTRFVRAFPVNPAARGTVAEQPESWGYPTIRGQRKPIRKCRADYGYDGPFHLTTFIGGRGRALSAGFHARHNSPDGFADCVVRVIEETSFPDTGGQVVKYRALVEYLPDD